MSEREGKLYAFENREAVSEKRLVLDLSARNQGENDSGLLGDTWTFNRATFEWTGSASDTVSPRTEHAVAPVPGLGYVLWDAYYVGRMDICVATMFSVGLLGFVSDANADGVDCSTPS